MKPKFRFLIPLIVLAALALSAVGVAFGREITSFEFFKTRDEIEITGMLEAVDGTTWTVDGQVIAVPASAEIKGVLMVGQVVKVHALMSEDGTLTAREIELAQADDLEDDNANDNSDEDELDDDNANDNSDDDELDDDNANDNSEDDDNANDNSDDDEWDDDNANDNSDDDSDDDSNDNDDDSDDDEDDDDDDDGDDD
jgi:hypothetical protein